jgi:hypothetical protein
MFTPGLIKSLGQESSSKEEELLKEAKSVIKQ